MSRTISRTRLGLASLCLFFAGASSASAQSAPGSGVAPGANLRLVVQHAHGRPPFQFVGDRVVIRGIVTPFVSAQKVSVSFYRDGRRVASKSVSVLDLHNGSGQFHIGYASPRPGLLTVKASHVATAQLGALAARSSSVRLLSANLGVGANGPAVRLLQDQLSALHYSIAKTGVFDEASARAVIAYRKMTGLPRVPTTDVRVFHLLARRAGFFHVRYRGEGRHVEANLTRQVLAEIEPGGRVRRIYTISSGKPSTPTVLGRFQVYLKTPGVNTKGMVDSNYFIRGYAIHGYAEVPPYAASHGCLRVPIPDAASIYAWVRLGTPVDVYTESGRGSRHVSEHAGP